VRERERERERGGVNVTPKKKLWQVVISLVARPKVAGAGGQVLAVFL